MDCKSRRRKLSELSIMNLYHKALSLSHPNKLKAPAFNVWSSVGLAWQCRPGAEAITCQHRPMTRRKAQESAERRGKAQKRSVGEGERNMDFLIRFSAVSGPSASAPLPHLSIRSPPPPHLSSPTTFAFRTSHSSSIFGALNSRPDCPT
jgi:hypothetical protein